MIDCSDADVAGAHAPATSPLQIAGKVARGFDRVLTVLAAILLMLALLYSGYALWDTWRIYEDAGVDESLLAYKPTLENGGEGFEELMNINPDVCAWLTIEDTGIDYPVVQGDDNVTYLNTDVRGEFSLSGSVFLDCRNSRDFSDSYSLLYGHHMEGGAMFGALDSFAGDEFFDEHDKGFLYLPDCIFEIELFAYMKVDAYDEQVFSPGDLRETEMERFLERIEGESERYRDIGVNPDDRIIALSTCSDASTNGRTVVLGRLVELTSGDSEVVEKK